MSLVLNASSIADMQVVMMNGAHTRQFSETSQVIDQNPRDITASKRRSVYETVRLLNTRQRMMSSGFYSQERSKDVTRNEEWIPLRAVLGRTTHGARWRLPKGRRGMADRPHQDQQGRRRHCHVLWPRALSCDLLLRRSVESLERVVALDVVQYI
jgi:hypothetical protein